MEIITHTTARAYVFVIADVFFSGFLEFQYRYIVVRIIRSKKKFFFLKKKKKVRKKFFSLFFTVSDRKTSNLMCERRKKIPGADHFKSIRPWMSRAYVNGKKRWNMSPKTIQTKYSICNQRKEEKFMSCDTDHSSTHCNEHKNTFFH